jgi:hypothetical protein
LYARSSVDFYLQGGKPALDRMWSQNPVGALGLKLAIALLATGLLGVAEGFWDSTLALNSREFISSTRREKSVSLILASRAQTHIVTVD